MADIKQVSNLGNLKRLSEGLSGGPMFKDLMEHPEMSFDDPRPMTGMDPYTFDKPTQLPIVDVYNKRRSNGSI